MNHYLIKNSNCVLREIFYDENNLYLLKNFVEEILAIKIIDILQKNSLEEKVKHFYPDNIKGIIDLQVLTDDDEKINIGVQIIDGQYIQEKILIYGALIHGMQDIECAKDTDNRTITINILDMDYFSTQEYHKKINFAEEKLVFHILELPKFKKSNIETNEEAWISYFKADSKDMIEKARKKSSIINELDFILDKYWKNEKI